MKQLLIFISVICSVNLSAQVTIGALKEPHEAAVLDLSQVELQNLGLLLPRVKLTDLMLFQLPALNLQEERDATGMLVYNEAHVNDEVYPGIYVWDGAKWGRINDGTLPPPMPIMATPAIEKIEDACNGVLFYIIPGNYHDWNAATDFVWTLTVEPSDYTPVPVTSGIKNSYFFVPYDATSRDYSVSVVANGSAKPTSIAATDLQENGHNNGTSNFFINGSDCYDIKKTAYEDKDPPVATHGVMASRIQLDPAKSYPYEVKGNGTLPSYLWSISDPDNILSNPPEGATNASINIQFNQDVLDDTWLIDHPDHERIVVLTCLVTDNNGCKYVVSKGIKVGDRDCCTSLFDIEGNAYTAVRFGTAGCWMTENLAVTKNEKLDVQLSSNNLPNSANNARYEPCYTFPATSNSADAQISLEDARSSSNLYGSVNGSEVGKPGLLYNWAAAVGAEDGTSTNPRGACNATAYPSNAGMFDLSTTIYDASRAASKYEDICPVGWYLPSDKEWSVLEREISSANYSQYSTASEAPEANWDEAFTSARGSHGPIMRNPYNINGSVLQYPGVSKPKESGFSGLLVGDAHDAGWNHYGQDAFYWSSTSYSLATSARLRYLNYDNQGVHRSSAGKWYLYSVRCKKLED